MPLTFQTEGDIRRYSVPHPGYFYIRYVDGRSVGQYARDHFFFDVAPYSIVEILSEAEYVALPE